MTREEKEKQEKSDLFKGFMKALKQKNKALSSLRRAGALIDGKKYLIPEDTSGSMWEIKCFLDTLYIGKNISSVIVTFPDGTTIIYQEGKWTVY